MLIVVSGALRGGPLERLLGCRPLRYVGQRSYGIYLIHAEVRILFDNALAPNGPLSFGLSTVALIVTLLLAAASYRWVEQPLRVRLSGPRPLGPTAVLIHVIVLASAWLYNAWLKNTPFSVVPFAFSFGLLPTLVTVSSTSPAFAAWWALGAGALLGTAAHFANVLPDLEADRVTGIRGLPHRLGVRGSGLVIAIALGAASALLYSGVPTLLQAVGFALGVALAVASIVLALRGNATRILFRLIMIAALVDVVMLAASGGSLYSAR